MKELTTDEIIMLSELVSVDYGKMLTAIDLIIRLEKSHEQQNRLESEGIA
ncbi:hypothetical protein [Pseudolactococcus insecticola]|uniref:Phage protein n=1 Tax=Pseudolactococcus insecticola TaxID=2709158 RepID=A0A6A0B9F1_9LACT|nr:hypothetical protein [Lactococcus insecticola]GFH41436.1 hypothetical protein Hs20B_18340 [Lactococcus insecticola]